MTRLFACFLSFLLALCFLGCGSSEPTSTPPPGPAMGGPPTGNKVFDMHCLNCHATQASSPPRKGPSLAKVGATRTPDWLAEHVKSPKSHSPGSTMPEFAKTLSAEDLKSVTEFMTGLK